MVVGICVGETNLSEVTFISNKMPQVGQYVTIEYDGKDFNGWQKQPNKLNIQGNIEQAIKIVTGEEVELNASGRTDAGVHALRTSSKF